MAKILIVDDEHQVRGVLQIWLKRNGHTAVHADGGDAALDLLRSQMFDVLITDVSMPQLDGLSLISHRAVIDSLKGVIVLTGRCDFEKLSTSHGGPKMQFVRKPFSPVHIVRVIEDLVAAEPVIATP